MMGQIRTTLKNLQLHGALFLHCIIHQQVLCGKYFDISCILYPVVFCGDFIQGHALNHRLFQVFLE